jgi:hypothetical protein
MDKHQIVFRYFLALAAMMASVEAASPEAEPPEVNCLAVAPCSTIPRLVALPPDGPENTTDATALPTVGELDIVRGMTLVKASSLTGAGFGAEVQSASPLEI